MRATGDVKKNCGGTQGLDFKPEDFGRPASELSGGWQMRLELAKVLLEDPRHHAAR